MDGVCAWYAVCTALRAEKKVKERLDKMDVQNYLPLKTEYRVWNDRKKKMSVPLIAGYIFVYVPETAFMTVLTTPGVVAFLKKGNKALITPEAQIERLRFVENNFEEPIEMSYDKIPAGTLVEIVHGRLTGLQGELVEFRNKFRIVLRLDNPGCALIAVPLSCAGKVKT